ncbi:MAG: HD domain-containing protein [Treponemataceae bacterium]|nr:HD domain-containing protein [Treponemataceae bacterium]
MQIPYVLKKMNEIFSKNGFKAYLVGGAVRDYLLGKEISDWDLTTNARPEEVSKIFHKVIPTGINHGTVTVLFMKESIEVTTFRTESDYSDGRHPDKVEYCGNIEEDLSRRDFTINAIAASLEDGSIVDPFDGQTDLKNRIIRTVGKAEDRFNEDGLRPVRAIRFAAKLNFKIEEETYRAIPKCLNKTKGISLERFRDEFCKLMTSEKPSVGLKLMEESGIMQIFLPELAQCRNVEQKDYRQYHVFDVLDHLIYACDGAPKDNLNLRIAALLHDIGKPQAKKDIDENGKIKHTFLGHEKFSSEISRKILTRLKFPNSQIDYICHLVEMHMFNYESSWSDAAVRRFIVKAGKECIPDLFDLRMADMFGKNNERTQTADGRWNEKLLEFKERIDRNLEENIALSLKSLAVNGKDLIEAGIQPGKKMGMILEQLFQYVLEEPERNEKKQLLCKAKQLSDQIQ